MQLSINIWCLIFINFNYIYQFINMPIELLEFFKYHEDPITQGDLEIIKKDSQFSSILSAP